METSSIKTFSLFSSKVRSLTQAPSSNLKQSLNHTFFKKLKVGFNLYMATV